MPKIFVAIMFLSFITEFSFAENSCIVFFEKQTSLSNTRPSTTNPTGFWRKLARSFKDTFQKNVAPNPPLNLTPLEHEAVSQNLRPVKLRAIRDSIYRSSFLQSLALFSRSDGCYANAHILAKKLEWMGIDSLKVFVSGGLARQSPEVTFQTMLGSIFFKTQTTPPRNYEFNYHVAVVVMVKQDKQIIPMVIDPMLFNEPVTLAQWEKSLRNASLLGAKFPEFVLTSRYAYKYDDAFQENPVRPTPTSWRPEDLYNAQEKIHYLKKDHSALQPELF